MNWVFVALLEPILFALTNVIDSHLSNRLFKSAWVLTVLVAATNALFLPVVWVFDQPGMIAANLVPYIILVAAIELFYAYPYYKALQHDDTSVAVSLFSLGRIFVPILAFFFVGENLRPVQYLGFAIITFASASLTFDPRLSLRLNKSFFYMLLASSLLAVEIVVYKYIFNNIDWATGFVWTVGISAFIGLTTLLAPKFAQETKTEFPILKKHWKLLLVVGVLGFGGSIGFSYSISQVPATVSRTIGSFQPFFVLLYAVMFHRLLPHVFKEEISLRSIGKKLILFVAMVIGTILTIRQ